MPVYFTNCIIYIYLNEVWVRGRVCRAKGEERAPQWDVVAKCSQIHLGQDSCTLWWLIISVKHHSKICLVSFLQGDTEASPSAHLLCCCPIKTGFNLGVNTNKVYDKYSKWIYVRYLEESLDVMHVELVTHLLNCWSYPVPLDKCQGNDGKLDGNLKRNGEGIKSLHKSCTIFLTYMQLLTNMSKKKA